MDRMDQKSSTSDVLRNIPTVQSVQKLQFQSQHQRLMQYDNENEKTSPKMHRKINKTTTKAVSAMDLSESQQDDIDQQHQNSLSLMLHQQQKYPQQNHPVEQQMYQQFNQKPQLSQLMKMGPNHNASLADFRSIINNQSVDDLIASRDQINAIVNAQKHSDYIVSDYMDKIQTRIALLETELKFADRKLHLLYSEYNDMLIKIEKLESLTIAQQSVLANLMDLCKNQSQEVNVAKTVQANSTLFGFNPQDMVMNRLEPFNQHYQQETMVDKTQTEFNEMLEDLKNEAIIDELHARNNLGVAQKIIHANQYPFVNENIQDYENDTDYETLMELLSKPSNSENFQFFKQLFEKEAENQADLKKQQMFQHDNTLETFKNPSEADLDTDFFQCGELNKNLFSSLGNEVVTTGHISLDMIYEDNEDKADCKENSPSNENKTIDMAKNDSNSLELTSSSKKSKGKKKKHHQQLQQQHLQLHSSPDDQLVHNLVDEILKIEGMTNLLSKNQLDELKKLIKTDLKYFKKLKNLDSNYLNLLLNPQAPSSPNNVWCHSMSLEEEDLKFLELVKKIKKNMEILKTLEHGEIKTDMKSPAAGSIYNEDEYIKSLKKSLDRHNSMQLLLHMQHPNLQSKSPSVLNFSGFLSEDPLNYEEGSSPPPPAPNSDSNSYFKSDTEDFNGLDQEWNPFHVDIMMIKEQKKKENEPFISSNLSPYRMCGQRSPKNTKSDSGLSSMSGFSSFEKSPNSPSSSSFDQLHSRNFRASGLNQDYLKMISNYQKLKLQSESVPSSFLFSEPSMLAPESSTETTDAIYSEENLNYIKELSQNVPICSIYENKSIFDDMATIKTPSAWEVYEKNHQNPPTVECMKSYPDLIVDQDEQKIHSSQPRLNALMEQKKILNQQLKQEQFQQKLRKTQSKQKQLTDRLVYYPSPMSIADYNSSMNLEYQREYPAENMMQKPYQRDAQNVQIDEYMQHAHAQQQIHLQQIQQKKNLIDDPNGLKKAGGSEKASYLNKVHSWLPEIKLKKMSKRHRSQSLSLPAERSGEEMSRKYRLSLKKTPSSAKAEHESGTKQKEIYVMKSYMKGKKKQLVHTMSNIMSKAKVYRRHSFSHHVSDDEENNSQQSPSHARATRSSSSAVPVKRNFSDTETDISSMFSDGDENEMVEYDGGSSLPVFATVGDSLVKHSDTGDSDKNSDRPISDSSGSDKRKSREIQQESMNSESNSFNLNFTSTSMEFAVSRKVGIFRKKSSVSDEQNQTTSPVGANIFPEKAEGKTDQTENIGRKIQPGVLMKTHSIYVDSVDDESGQKSNGDLQGSFQPRPPVPSPRFEHSRSNSVKGNSLDVPGNREDEDNKSQHSFRTISSRRQSTEDSIDTDDEYFYYEMRNLEELERNSHMESILQDDKNEIINNIIHLDTLGQNKHEPDEDVKKQMAQVLNELKMKVKVRESESRQDVANNNNKGKNIYDKFSLVTNVQDMPWNRDTDDDEDYEFGDHMNQLNQIEMEIRDTTYGKIKKKRKKGKAQKYSSPSSSSEDDDGDQQSVSSSSQRQDDYHLNVEKFDRHSQSSGVTSGPDSPIQSDDDETGDFPGKSGANYDDFKTNQKNERLLEHSMQPPNKNDRGAEEKLVQSTAAVETELKKEKPSLSKMMQLSSTVSTDSTNQDSGISDGTSNAGIMNSKWKLLKTLKERKEMNNQVKIKEEEDGVKEKVVSY